MSLTKVSYSMITGSPVNVKDFGAKGDGITNDTAAIQSAIDYAIYNNGTNQALGNKNVVVIPAGTYVISNTIHLGYGTSFTSVLVQGAGMAALAEDTFNGTTIDATAMNDRPAFNIQGGFMSGISDLSIKGAGYTYFRGITNATTIFLDADWTDLSLPTNSYSRYAPYAGITIDAYAGVAPSPAYPSVSYPAFLGTVNQYGKNISSAPEFTNVAIYGFVAGIVNHPSDSNSMGDFLVLSRCVISYNKYGVSIGNTQSRNVSLNNCIGEGAYTFFTNRTHGKQTGQFGGDISNCSFGIVANLVDLTLSYSGTILVNNLYAERLYKIGNILMTGAYTSPIKFESSTFVFTGQSVAYDGGLPASVLDGGAQVRGFISFDSCFFSDLPSVLATQFTSSDIVFTKCTIQTAVDYAQASISPYVAIAKNATGSFICGQNLVTSNSEYVYHSYNNVTGLNAGMKSANNLTVGALASGIPFTNTQVTQFNGSSSFSPRLGLVHSIDCNNLVSATLVNTTLTVEFPAGYTSNIGFVAGKPGDVIIHTPTMSVFFIRSRTANVLIAELQNNYITSGAGVVPVTPIVFDASTTLFTHNCRIFSPSVPLYGDFTSGSNVITNVSDVSLFATELVVGTQLVCPDYSYDAVIPYNQTNITSYDAGAKTITVAGNATRTIRNRALPMWVALPPANL